MLVSNNLQLDKKGGGEETVSAVQSTWVRTEFGQPEAGGSAANMCRNGKTK